MTSNPSIQPPQPQTAAGAAATPAQPPAYRRFLQGSVAAMAGGAASHPLDLLKVRMQIQGESAAAAAAGEAGQRLGMLGMAKLLIFLCILHQGLELFERQVARTIDVVLSEQLPQKRL